MGLQSSRLYFQGLDHKDIYFQGHYHDKMIDGRMLKQGFSVEESTIWEKLDGILRFKMSQCRIPKEGYAQYWSASDKYLYLVDVKSIGSDASAEYVIYRTDDPAKDVEEGEELFEKVATIYVQSVNRWTTEFLSISCYGRMIFLTHRTGTGSATVSVYYEDFIDSIDPATGEKQITPFKKLYSLPTDKQNNNYNRFIVYNSNLNLLSMRFGTYGNELSQCQVHNPVITEADGHNNILPIDWNNDWKWSNYTYTDSSKTEHTSDYADPKTCVDGIFLCRGLKHQTCYTANTMLKPFNEYFPIEPYLECYYGYESNAYGFNSDEIHKIYLSSGQTELFRYVPSDFMEHSYKGILNNKYWVCLDISQYFIRCCGAKLSKNPVPGDAYVYTVKNFYNTGIDWLNPLGNVYQPSLLEWSVGYTGPESFTINNKWYAIFGERESGDVTVICAYEEGKEKKDVSNNKNA